jgi:hypothetical protein
MAEPSVRIQDAGVVLKPLNWNNNCFQEGKVNGKQFHQAAESPLPLPSSFVRFLPFAGGGALFLEGTRRVWGMNAAAAFLWRALGDIRHFDELAGTFAERFSLDETTARRDAAATLACFEDEGLLGEGRAFDFPEERGSEWETSSSALPLTEPVKWSSKEIFQLPNHIVEFCTQDAGPGIAFIRHMAHLSLNRRGKCDTRLAVVDNGAKDAWDIYLNGRRLVERAAENEILPHLFTLVFIRTCEALQDALLFHAAVIGGAAKTVLLPAEAGSGKTTLAAALAARGCRFFSDELAAMNIKTRRVAPFPMPMSIKPGSVQALERYYPGLASDAVHHRVDGKHVRYLSPPPASLAGVGDTAATIDVIVYPIYQKGSKTRLSPLDKITALQKLAVTGSSDRKFLSADIEAMLALVEQTPCFELIFSNLDNALESLEALVHT